MGATGRRSSAVDDAAAPIGSEPDMTAASLRSEVIAARTTRRWNLSTLQRISGLSARTIRDIETGTPERRYSVTTLGALDRAFGWTDGTAWRLWESGERRPETPLSELLEQMAELRRAVTQMSEEVSSIHRESEEGVERRPSWADDLVDLVGRLSPDDRRRVFDYVERLAPQ